MIEEVLAFWFGEPAKSTEDYGKKMRRWFMGGAELDVEIRRRFTALVERALAGELDDWARTVPGRLALILVIDQFARSVYRDRAEAFAGDARAAQLAVEAQALHLDRGLPVERRHFLMLPLLHAEDLALQDRFAVAMREIHDAAEPWQQPMLAMGLEQSQKYREVIARFGRFPHRNEALGRPSTPEETAFLVDWKAKMAPSGAKDL